MIINGQIFEKIVFQQPASGSVSLGADLAMGWTDANGNINPLAFLSDWFLPGSQIGPMSTGPSTLGAAGAIGGAGAGLGAFSTILK